MERFCKRTLGVFVAFLLASCDVPEYKYVRKDNYRELNDVINDYNDKYEKRELSKYNDNKLKSYTGFYKIGNPYKIAGKTYYPKEDRKYKEVGMASWYGEDFHNKKTANGEIYNMYDYTCAHRTLPLPSLVKITNLQNGKSMVVRVNDRGPFAKNRIVDVSKSVAKELGFYLQGTTKVKVEFLEKETDKMLKYLNLK